MINQNESINDLWNRIEIWATRNFPELPKTLADGASELQINNLMQFLAYPLPPTVRISLMRHNGQTSHPALFWYQDVYKLMSTEEIIEELENRIKLANAKKKSDAIPIALAGSGDKIWLKLHPNGEGPIRLRSHDDPNVPDLYHSYTDWLKRFVDDLEAGRYYTDEYNSLNRTFPQKEEVEQLIVDAIDKVAKMGGDVEMVIDLLSKATNQPKWIVTYRISTYRLSSDLDDKKYDLSENE